jgi:hypothetical protein
VPDPRTRQYSVFLGRAKLDIDVAVRHADDGFTVRLRGGTTIG